jgi:hypothetical protein
VRELWGLDGVISGYGQVAGACDSGEDPSDTANAGNFLTSCRTRWFLKKDSAPWSKKVRVD